MIKFLYTNYPKKYGQFLYFKNRLLAFPKLFLFILGFKIYFGSKEQDRWVIEEIFKYKKKGYFVDLAATNGLFENNTYVLEKKYEWSGIAIEPNSYFYYFLKKIRNCKCLNQVVLTDNSTIKFFENGPTGGIVGDEYDNNIQKRYRYINKNIKKVIKKNTKSLSKILEENKSPKIIDYMSLDVEGAETAIMKEFPFKKYIFLSMTIERPTKELNELLFKNDYIFIKNYKADSFYLHKKIYENIKNKIYTEKFFQIPPKKW
jgi:hypothetical protein